MIDRIPLRRFLEWLREESGLSLCRWYKDSTEFEEVGHMSDEEILDQYVRDHGDDDKATAYNLRNNS